MNFTGILFLESIPGIPKKGQVGPYHKSNLRDFSKIVELLYKNCEVKNFKKSDFFNSNHHMSFSQSANVSTFAFHLP